MKLSLPDMTIDWTHGFPKASGSFDTVPEDTEVAPDDPGLVVTTLRADDAFSPRFRGVLAVRDGTLLAGSATPHSSRADGALRPGPGRAHLIDLPASRADRARRGSPPYGVRDGDDDRASRGGRRAVHRVR